MQFRKPPLSATATLSLGCELALCRWSAAAEGARRAIPETASAPNTKVKNNNATEPTWKNDYQSLSVMVRALALIGVVVTRFIQNTEPEGLFLLNAESYSGPSITAYPLRFKLVGVLNASVDKE